MSENTPETAPETTGAEVAPTQEGAETANVPTTSPDVVITTDPGPAPDAETEHTDSGEAAEAVEGDPESTDEAVEVDVLGNE